MFSLLDLPGGHSEQSRMLTKHEREKARRENSICFISYYSIIQEIPQDMLILPIIPFDIIIYKSSYFTKCRLYWRSFCRTRSCYLKENIIAFCLPYDII